MANNSPHDIERLSKIEQTITYQDQQIQDLSDMVTQQWRAIDQLKKHLSQAKERLENLENPSDDLSDSGSLTHEIPPHY